MSTSLLDLHLRLLVLEYGRERVVRGLALIGEVTEAEIEKQLAAVAREKRAKPAKNVPSVNDILAHMELPPGKRERLATLAREFENKRFLGEKRLVERFLREHNAVTVPKSRVSALPKVLAILNSLSEGELSELLADCANRSSSSEFAHLAGAIMGKK